MPSILFVCTANQFRSPIAAACLRKSLASETTNAKWIIESAGTWAEAGLHVPNISLTVAGQLGLRGLKCHVTRRIDQFLLNQFDLIIPMEGNQKEAIGVEFPSIRKHLYLLSEIVDAVAYDIPDPIGSSTNPHAVGRELYMLITKGREKILQLATSLSKPGL